MAISSPTPTGEYPVTAVFSWKSPNGDLPYTVTLHHSGAVRLTTQALDRFEPNKPYLQWSDERGMISGDDKLWAIPGWTTNDRRDLLLNATNALREEFGLQPLELLEMWPASK